MNSRRAVGLARRARRSESCDGLYDDARHSAFLCLRESLGNRIRCLLSKVVRFRRRYTSAGKLDVILWTYSADE